MKNSLQNILILFIFLALSGCAQLAKHADTVKPTAKLTGARLANIDFNKVDLIFDLAVNNSNPVALDLAGLSYDLKVENQSLVSGTTAQAIKLKANATSPVQLPITLKFDDLKKLPGELWSKDKISYHLKTTFNIDIPVIGNYAIPVEKQGELPVPKIPDIKLKDVKIAKLNFTTAELIAQVEVKNPNNFSLGLSDLDYQLKVNQQNWGQGSITKSFNIPKNGSGIIEIPIKLNLLSAGSAAYKLLLDKSPVEYQLTGNATVDTGLELFKKQTIPLNIKGTTSLQ